MYYDIKIIKQLGLPIDSRGWSNVSNRLKVWTSENRNPIAESKRDK